MRRIVIIGLILGMIGPVSAATFFCPNTFKYINTGQNVMDILSACGEPTAKEEKNEPIQVEKPVQQMYYQLAAGVTGDSKLDLVVTVENDRVKSMTIAGQPVNSTTMCSTTGYPLKVGVSVAEVSTACGNPVAINETTVMEPVGKSAKVEVWSYDFGQYKPKIRLKFVNGILQEIQQ